MSAQDNIGPVHSHVLSIVTQQPGLVVSRIYAASTICRDEVQVLKILNDLVTMGLITRQGNAYCAPGTEIPVETDSQDYGLAARLVAISKRTQPHTTQEQPMMTLVEQLADHVAKATAPINAGELAERMQITAKASGNAINRAINAGLIKYTGTKRDGQRLYVSSGQPVKIAQPPIQKPIVLSAPVIPAPTQPTAPAARTLPRPPAFDPVDFIAAQNLNWLQGQAILCITQYARTGGPEPLHTARQMIDKLIEIEQAA